MLQSRFLFAFCQFAIGRCRGLPPTPGKSGGGGSNDSGAEAATAAAEEEANMDPAKEILATIGTGNAGKYLVASQVCRAMRASTVDRRGKIKHHPTCGIPFLYLHVTVL